jgi:hypothetical protein
MRALLPISGALLFAFLCSPTLFAYVPQAERVARAAAEANRGASRTGVLELDVALYLDGSQEAAETGKLLSHPGGFSRLELLGPEGVVERHLLRGRRYLASRDGAPLDAPRPLLPPLFLLQARSGDALLASLLTLGVPARQIALGYQGDRDCYVLGGRPPAGAAPAPPGPALWLDQESLEPLRFDRGDGVHFVLGSPTSFGEIRLPSRIEIVDESGPRARLQILGARVAPSVPESFRPEWLGAP